MPLQFGRKHCKLHSAAKTGDVQALRSILDSDTLLLESTDHHGKTPLLRACKYGNRGAVLALLRAGANLRAIDETKRNCLHHAVANGHVDVTEALLRRGAAPLLEQVNSAGQRPLDLHPARNQADIQRVLHQSNALWIRHGKEDSNDLVRVQSSKPPPVPRVPFTRHSTLHRERRSTGGAPPGSGYFVPSNTSPLLPCVPYAQVVWWVLYNCFERSSCFHNNIPSSEQRDQ